MNFFIKILISTAVLLGACTKGDPPVDPDDENIEVIEKKPFDVKLEGKTIFKVGERVFFTIEGATESIDFFSGEDGHEYEYREGKPGASGIRLNFGLHTATPESKALSLMVSTDFNGDVSSFENATHAQQKWIDATEKLQYPPKASTYSDVGPIDLSEFTIVGKPFYFAIKHVTILNNTGGEVAWTIRNLDWVSVLENKEEQIATMKLDRENLFGFNVVHQNTQYKTFVSQNEATKDNIDRFAITGKKNAEGAETWIISKEFSGIQQIMGDKHRPVSIQSVGNSPLKSYGHLYKTPGIYTAHFMASVLDANGEMKEEVKFLTFTIEP